ncbi:hypothetical protein ES703_115961 [subsurface metagenome]
MSLKSNCCGYEVYEEQAFEFWRKRGGVNKKLSKDELKERNESESRPEHSVFAPSISRNPSRKRK